MSLFGDVQVFASGPYIEDRVVWIMVPAFVGGGGGGASLWTPDGNRPCSSNSWLPGIEGPHFRHSASLYKCLRTRR